MVNPSQISRCVARRLADTVHPTLPAAVDTILVADDSLLAGSNAGAVPWPVATLLVDLVERTSRLWLDPRGGVAPFAGEALRAAAGARRHPVSVVPPAIRDRVIGAIADELTRLARQAA